MARLAWVASALVSEPAFRSDPSYRRSLQPAMTRTIGTPGQVVSPMPRSSTGDERTTAAIAAVQKWPHRPNLLNGLPLKFGRSSRWPSERPEGNTRIWQTYGLTRIRDEFQVQRFSVSEKSIAPYRQCSGYGDVRLPRCRSGAVWIRRFGLNRVGIWQGNCFMGIQCSAAISCRLRH
jgi:hypothetical protein